MNDSSEKTRYFQVGGALSADNPSYIDRPADGQLLAAVRQGELCLILAPRQTGKTSLMVQTKSRLAKQGIAAGFADFQHLRGDADIGSWFGAIVHQLGRSLCLPGDS